MRWLPDPTGPLTVLVTLGLIGCATVAPQIIKQLPPAELLQDCPDVSVKPKTNGELAKQRDGLKASLKACNIDKQRLREWVERKE